MKENILLTLKYWYKATWQPLQAILELKDNPRKLAVSFWINFIFAVLYTLTVVIYYFVIHRMPAFPPWVPIPPEKYYLYQIFWTIPWGLATWVMISGSSHLLAVTGKPDHTRYSFDDALMVCGLGWVVPNLILMWIPETLLVPLFGVFWPDWAEVLRLMVVPPLWQTAIVAVGLRETHEIGWLKATVVGLVSVMVFFIMFLAFMR
jgi:hypothetical protein